MPTRVWQRPLGAVPLPEGGFELRVWAPAAARVGVRVHDVELALDPVEDGIWAGEVFADAGDDYLLVLDGDAVPDPWSRSQPAGVRGPSRFVDTSAFAIASGPDLRLDELVLYELHVGTFTAEGTFDAVVPYLDGLRALGVTAIELMPVATFPGDRGWGYDGIYAYAPHHAYGGPEGLARLVDAAHSAGLGVFLDVVYNHFGPGAEPVTRFGPFLTDDANAWGSVLDYSQRGVREWAIQNAAMWTTDYRIDGLRLDAVHAIHDDSPVHVLRELKERVPGVITSEMGMADFRPLDEWGHDAMWLDNLHHELHVALTGEQDGYYAQHGTPEGLVGELTRPQREQLIVSAQNHDQVGNRALGDRLPPDAHRVALAVVLFSTYTPLLFMGEEHDERAPFQFFSDHDDPFIAEATRTGRKQEFAAFSAFSGAEVPDPQSAETFERSHVSHPEPDPFYAELIALRRTLPPELDVQLAGGVLTLRRGEVTLVADLDAKTVEVRR